MTVITTAGAAGVSRFTRNQLLRTAHLFSTDPYLRDLVDLTSSERTWHRLDATAHLEIWVVAWPVGSSTGWHDHLQSEGAFLTVEGELAEQTWSGGRPQEHSLWEGEGRSFGAHHLHTVSNPGDRAALSVHVYSPALRGMTRYKVVGNQLRQTSVERAGEQW